MMPIKPYILIGFALIALGLVAVSPAFAQDREGGAVSETRLPLPRFASLSAGKVFMRTGPGRRYPVKWVYQRDGLPVEIVEEYDVWRKIRDHDGDEGWVLKILLSGKRTALVLGAEPVVVRSSNANESRPVARLEPGVVTHLDKCEGGWCRLESGGYRGWLERKNLWGIYAGEELN